MLKSLWVLFTVPGLLLARTDFSAWKDSTRVFINASASGANVAANLTNFPLLLRLNASVLDFKDLGTGGRDLRFATKDGTLLSHEIESFNAAAEDAVVWIKAPLIDSLSASQYFVMYWNNPAATDISNGAAVFDTADGYAGVWHLNDATGQALGDTGATKIYRDATLHKNHGDDFISGPQDTGAIGLGQAFDGVDDHIQIPSSPNLKLRGPFSLSIWCRAVSLKPSTDGDTLNALIRKGDENPNSYQLAVRGGYLALALDDDDATRILSKEKLIPGRYYHVAAAYEGKTVKLYINGVFDSEFAVPTAAGELTRDDRPLQIGGRVRNGDVSSHDQWHGSLDEAWVSRLSHSSAYFKMSYENQKAGSNVLAFSDFPPVVPPDNTVKAAWTYDTILTAGSEIVDAGKFRLANDGSGSTHVLMKPTGDTVAQGVMGAEALIRIISADAATPAVVFTLDPAIAAGRHLFKVNPDTGTAGRLIDLGEAATGRILAGSGSWIFARDTSAPVVRVLDQGVTSADSSWILLSVADNTAGVSVACVPDGVRNGSVPPRTAATGAPIRFAFHPADGTASVRVRFTVDDGSHRTAFPATASPAYVLSRSLPNFQAPVFLNGGLAWSLVGIPIRASHALSLGDLAGTSGANRLYIAAWRQDAVDAAAGKYEIGDAADSLPTGGGLWLAAGKETSTLPMGKVYSVAPGPDQTFAIRLQRGWNQIAAPTLEHAPWIISKKNIAAYDRSPVKGLHEYVGNGKYLDADTLVPWKGYFVFSDIDTTIRLLPSGSGSPKATASKTPAALAPAENYHGLKVLFEPVAFADGSAPAPIGLRLGAAAYAQDGLAREDEAMPTAPGQGAYLAAMRGGRGLRTDVIGLHPQGLHTWKIAWTGTGAASRNGEPARLKLTGLELPEGSQLWAAAPSWSFEGHPGRNRGNGARRLMVGDVVEVPDLDGDTLAIWAASAGEWSPGDPVPGLAPVPAALAAEIDWSPQGGMLRVDLPRSSGVIASVYAVDGRCAARLKHDRLAPGRHLLALPGTGRMHGLVFVVLDFPGAPGTQRKILRTLATGP